MRVATKSIPKSQAWDVNHVTASVTHVCRVTRSSGRSSGEPNHVVVIHALTTRVPAHVSPFLSSPRISLAEVPLVCLPLWKEGRTIPGAKGTEEGVDPEIAFDAYFVLKYLPEASILSLLRL